MSYATQANMIDRFGEAELIQLTDRDGATGAIVTAVLDQALADADAEIDGYLGGRYSLPLASSPAVLTRIGADIARYRLYDDAAPDEVRKRYEDVVRLLRDIAKGLVSLGLADPPASSGSPAYSAPDRLFSRDTLQDF